MDDKQRAKFDLDWAREMDGQFFGCAPCVPYDDDSTDVLHLCLNSFGSATLECFDRHLRREYPDDAELRALTEAVRDKVKERLKASGVLVEFWTEKGKDVNGPKLRRLLLDSAALYDLIMLMLPLYELLEEKKHESVDDFLYADEMGAVAEAAAAAAAAVPVQPGETRAGKGKGGRPSKASKQKGCCAKKGKGCAQAGIAKQKKKPARTVTLPDFAALAGGDSDDEDEEGEPMETEPTQTEASSSDQQPDQPEPAAEPEMRPTYAQRVCSWFAALCIYYAFLHTDHGDTADLMKTKKNEKLAEK